MEYKKDKPPIPPPANIYPYPLTSSFFRKNTLLCLRSSRLAHYKYKKSPAPPPVAASHQQALPASSLSSINTHNNPCDLTSNPRPTHSPVNPKNTHVVQSVALATNSPLHGPRQSPVFYPTLKVERNATSSSFCLDVTPPNALLDCRLLGIPPLFNRLSRAASLVKKQPDLPVTLTVCVCVSGAVLRASATDLMRVATYLRRSYEVVLAVLVGALMRLPRVNSGLY